MSIRNATDCVHGWHSVLTCPFCLTEGFHASLKDAHQSITEHRQATCPHAYEVLDFGGNPVSKPHTSIFCPDCGLRIGAPGPTWPF